MTDIRKIIDLVEAKSKSKDLELEKLPYGRSALAPVMSQSTINYHYGKLAKGYVDRYNNNEGDKTFNEAGAFLHNIFFNQFRLPRNNNRPSAMSRTLIESKWGNFEDFKSQVKKQALGLQGSGWVYMARNGEIKVIRNHSIKRDIALLIDMWEHAYNLDYASDKSKYLDNLWRIIDWDVINHRLTGSAV